MPAGPEPHRSLAAALPVRGRGPLVDLGCGRGPTLQALRDHLGPEVQLTGVEKELPVLDERLARDANVRPVAADLREPLPFPDASFEAACCHNTLECLPEKQAFLREVARVLRPAGCLLLSHTDFDTMVFNASDVDLTRRLVHANADTQEKWMDASDGMIGRKLVAIARHSPFECSETFAWVTVHTDFEQDSVAHTAVRSIAATVRRDHHHELASRFDDWVDDLRTLAERASFSTASTTTRCYCETARAGPETGDGPATAIARRRRRTTGLPRAEPGRAALCAGRARCRPPSRRRCRRQS